MDARKRTRGMLALGALTLMGTVGCAADKNIDVWNASDATVTVQLGTEDLGEITPDGGVVLLETPECYEGPIVVTYAEGRTVTLDRPICPGQTLSITDATARIRESASQG